MRWLWSHGSIVKVLWNRTKCLKSILRQMFTVCSRLIILSYDFRYILSHAFSILIHLIHVSLFFHSIHSPAMPRHCWTFTQLSWRCAAKLRPTSRSAASRDVRSAMSTLRGARCVQWIAVVHFIIHDHSWSFMIIHSEQTTFCDKVRWLSQWFSKWFTVNNVSCWIYWCWCWLVGWLAGWLVGRLVGRSVGWLVGWLLLLLLLFLW